MKRLEDLAGYVTGELNDAAAEQLEEALFDAPDDPDVTFLDRFVRYGTTLHAHGTFEMGVTRAHIDTLRAQGLSVQLLEPGPPSSTPQRLTLDPTAELIATRLPLGRPDLQRVDVELHLEAYNESKVIKDAFVDPSDGAIYGLCERALAEIAWGHGRTRIRVVERDGNRAVLAEWNFIGAGP